MNPRPLVVIPRYFPMEGAEELYQHCEVAMPSRGVFAPEELIKLLERAEAIFANANVDAAMIDAAPQLRIISNYGAGYDNVDVAAATRRGIPVTNIPDTTAQATAEQAMALMLCLLRRTAELDRRLRRKEGAPHFGTMTGRTLQGKTLGIIGMGHIGRTLARMAAPFLMNVIYYSRHRLRPEQEMGARYVPLDELLATSDIVSLHTPLTPQTRHMIGGAELARMKPDAVLINVARGAVVDETALVAALEKGVIAGAGLDVFEQEPAVPLEFLTMENVVLTPHVGTNIRETRREMTWAACERILIALGGQRPPDVVNPEIYDGYAPDADRIR